MSNIFHLLLFYFQQPPLVIQLVLKSSVRFFFQTPIGTVQFLRLFVISCTFSPLVLIFSSSALILPPSLSLFYESP
eukprot:UN28171